MILSTTDLKRSKKTAFCIFGKHAPIKRKFIRSNEALFMTKEPQEPCSDRKIYKS